jgi:glycosyltransferase involved in cell wall biosynthesis
MPKLVFILRPKNIRAQSIEKVFLTLGEDLKKNYTFNSVDYFTYTSFIGFLFYIIMNWRAIFHITGQNYYLAIILKIFGIKYVVTYHDVGHFKNLSGIKKIAYYFFWIYFPIRWAEHLVCISDYTRNDISRLVKLDEIANTVIYNPVLPLFQPKTTRINYSDINVLIVGTAVHKNLKSMFYALCGFTNVSVHIVGELNNEDKEILDFLRIKYLNYINLCEIDLVELYARMDFLLFISLHEGFGLPIVEAQATGLSVVTSCVCSIPEVAGKGAFFIEDPLNVGMIKMNLIRIFDRRCESNVLEKIEIGFKNVERFKVSKVSRQYVEIYKQLQR